MVARQIRLSALKVARKGLYIPQHVSDARPLPLRPSEIAVFHWNRYSQRIQTARPAPPRPARGGILADEMGLGKVHIPPAWGCGPLLTLC